MKTDNCSSDFIYSYSRAQAIADGVLIDLSEYAKELGIKPQTVFTNTLMQTVLDIPEKYSYQNERGRCHDILFLAISTLKKMIYEKNSQAYFKVNLPSTNTEDSTKLLLIVLDLGDQGEPVITIGFPDDF